MINEKIKILLDKYAKGQCNLEEEQLLELWFEKQENKSIKEFANANKDVIWQNIDKKLTYTNPRKLKRANYIRWSVAASLTLALTIVSYYYLSNRSIYEHPIVSNANSLIQPGGNKAILTLSNGDKIILDETAGAITSDNGVAITKNSDGMIVYNASSHSVSKDEYNTIETPRGGMYQVILPDGSQVTLNSESSLRFSLGMLNKKERIVELTGEGYFDIVKDTNRPFLVNSKQQQIQVLGTVFNVNTYNPARTLTALIEGSVLLNKNTKMVAGQLAILEENKINIKKVEVSDYVDWKNNAFIFRNEKLASIMERLARWYDIEYDFTDNQQQNIVFNGEISRYETVDKVLNLLSLTSNLKFELHGRSIHIK